MENVNKIMFMGFGALLFSLALFLAVAMFGYVDGMIDNSEKIYSVRKVLEGEQFERCFFKNNVNIAMCLYDVYYSGLLHERGGGQDKTDKNN